MEHKHRKYFREEIRKMFIRYALFPILIISLLFYNVLFIYGKRLAIEQNHQHNQQISEYLDDELNTYVDEVDNLSTSMVVARVILRDLDKKEVYEAFYKYVNRHTIKSNFYIFDHLGNVVLTNVSDENLIYSSKDMLMWGIFKRMNYQPTETVMLYDTTKTSQKLKPVYTMGRAILDGKQEIIGYVVFEIIEQEFQTLLAGKQIDSIIITDRFDNAIVASNHKLLNSIGKVDINFRNNGEVNVEGKRYYTYKSEVLDGNMTVYTFTSLNMMYRLYLTGLLFLFSTTGALWLIMTYVARRISISKTKSMDDLLRGLERIKEGDLETLVDIRSEDEFQVLGEYYNEMILKLQHVIELNKEQARRSLVSELKQLEAQFNPHFLFNTLEMLKYTIKLDSNKAVDILVSFANILRYSINNNQQNVTLFEDLKYIDEYLQLQKYRFESKFDYEITAPLEVQTMIVPKLILQPIIENSIKYGFANKDQLKIYINVEKIENDVMITVTDNGDGISDERLLEIQTLLNNRDNESEHIGLHNVQRRIQLQYGDEYGVLISSELDKGTKVVLKLKQTDQLNVLG